MTAKRIHQNAFISVSKSPNYQLRTTLPMAQNSPPLPLICIGRLRKVAESQEQLVAPHFSYTGIIDLENFSSPTLRVLLASLNPYPVGVLVGGGVSVDVQDEVEKVVQEHQAAGRYDLKFVRIPIGLRERVGANEANHWLRDALGKAFGVTW